VNGRAAIALIAVATAGCVGAKTGMARTTIPQHATLRVAAESLSHAGLIGSPTLFRIYAKLRRGDKTIRAGTYALPRSLGWSGVLDALNGGKGIVSVMTIPEGFSVAQITRVMSQRLGVPPESVEAAVRDTVLRRRLDVRSPTLEGYLFPDTYTLAQGATAREVVDLMVKRFEQAWKPQWTARLDTLGLSRHDAMSLASIVEKEAKLPQERPVIAGVYLNRLRRGMLLQADPTVQYALPVHVARVTYKDLRVKSDYNTYTHKGLPPGPIASPGVPSILAALYPANVPYRYFVAFPDGHHEFHVTQAQHETAVRLSRKAWAAYYLLHPDTSVVATSPSPPPTNPAPARTKSAKQTKRAK
jgi:UPF0755 protein